MSFVITFRALLAAVAATAIALLPSAAFAHTGHAALPAGFEARTLHIVDADGAEATLDGVSFTVSPTGTALTASNSTDAVLEITGEQAGEPLLRVSATDAEVNEASPQAINVEGAAVATESAAELLDLLYNRAEASWIGLPRGGSVTFMDHRAVPGHPPVRADHELGDVVHEWKVSFTYDGAPYSLQGDVTTVEAPATIPWIPIGIVAAVAVLGGGWFLRRRSPRQPAPTEEPATPRPTISVP